MFGRAARVACLAFAAWALLFAPGAAIEDVRTTGTVVPEDRVAAAVLAPTFGADSFVASRICRTDDGAQSSSCEGGTAVAVVAVTVAAGGLLARRGRDHLDRVDAVGSRRSSPPRAPPRV